MVDHWFDRLHKVLVRENPRRSLLRAAALVASLGAPFGAAAKKEKKGKKGNQGKNDGKKNRNTHKKKKSKVRAWLCDPYLLEACDLGSSFVSGAPAHCEETCERCTQEGSAFCLVPTGDDDSPRQPTCCHLADECCGHPNFGFGECCSADRCCRRDGDGHCLKPGETCCPEDELGFCPAGFGCCPGIGCASCDAPLVLNLATCACVDPDAWCSQSCVDPGQECCRPPGVSWVACVNTHGPDPDPNNCGGCNVPCVSPRWCCPGGICADIRVDNDHCGFGCQDCPPGQQCCHGRCLDSLLECCRDSERGVPWCSAGWSCCTLPDGANGCYGQNGCCDGRGNCY